MLRANNCEIMLTKIKMPLRVMMMVVSQHLCLSAQHLNGREGEDSLYFLRAGLNWVLQIMGVGVALVACLAI